MVTLYKVFSSDDIFASPNPVKAFEYNSLNLWMRNTFIHNPFWLSLSHPNPGNTAQMLYLHVHFNRTVGADGLANITIDRVFKDANQAVQGQGVAMAYNYAAGTILTKSSLQSFVNAADATPFTTAANHAKNFSQYILFFAEPPRLDMMLLAAQKLLQGSISSIPLTIFSVIVNNYGRMLRSANPIPANCVVTWTIAKDFFSSIDRTDAEKNQYNNVCNYLGQSSFRVPAPPAFTDRALHVAAPAPPPPVPFQVWGLQDKVYTYGQYLDEQDTPKEEELQEQFTAYIFVAHNKVVKSHGSEADVQRLTNAVLVRGDASAVAELSNVYEPAHLWFHNGSEVQYHGAFGSDQNAQEAATQLFEGKHVYIVVSGGQVVHSGDGVPEAKEVLPTLRAAAFLDL